MSASFTQPNELITPELPFVDRRVISIEESQKILNHVDYLFLKSDYIAILKFINEVENYVFVDKYIAYRLQLFKSATLRSIGLYTLAKEVIERLKFKSVLLENPLQRDEIKYSIFIEEGFIGLLQGTVVYTLEDFESAYFNYSSLLETNSRLNQYSMVLKAKLFSNIDIHQRLNYIDLALNYNFTRNQDRVFERGKLLIDKGQLLFEDNKFAKAMNCFQESLTIFKDLDNEVYLSKLYHLISITSLALGNHEDFNSYNTLYLKSIEPVESKISESLYYSQDFFTEQTEQVFNDRIKNRYYLTLMYVVFVLISIILLVIFFRRHYLKKKKNIELIRYNRSNFGNSNSSPIIDSVEVADVDPNNIAFVLSEIQASLIFLESFDEIENFINDYGLTGSQASNYLLATSDMSFVDLLFNYRIQYLVDSIQEQPYMAFYKVEFLSELAGFSSVQTFQTAFKKVVGISIETYLEIQRKK